MSHSQLRLEHWRLETVNSRTPVLVNSVPTSGLPPWLCCRTHPRLFLSVTYEPGRVAGQRHTAAQSGSGGFSVTRR